MIEVLLHIELIDKVIIIELYNWLKRRIWCSINQTLHIILTLLRPIHSYSKSESHTQTGGSIVPRGSPQSFPYFAQHLSFPFFSSTYIQKNRHKKGSQSHAFSRINYSHHKVGYVHYILNVALTHFGGTILYDAACVEVYSLQLYSIYISFIPWLLVCG